MATEVIAPSDTRTGIPLPIISAYEPPSVGNCSNGKDVVADWHHPFHPRAVLVSGSAGEVALRNSRVQWVNREEHNAYHRVFEGPRLPASKDLLRTVIFATAGHIPERGIKILDNEDVLLTRVPGEYREYLWRSKQIKVANANVVRDFLLESAFNKYDFKDVSETAIDEFLNTENRRRRIELGNNLLGLALYEATSELKQVYKCVRKKELLPTSSPRTVGRCAMNLVTRVNHKYTLQVLENRLQKVA